MASALSSKSKETTSGPDINTNPRGIPHAPFVANVEDHVGGPDAEVESALRQFQEAIAKYKYMEANLTQRRQGLEEKMPDFRKTLEMVEFMLEQREGKTKNGEDDAFDDLDDDVASDGGKKPLTTTFELNDTLYAQATVDDTDLVYLWLGASTMLSYTHADAIRLLTSKFEAAELALKNVTEDLEFIREQVTVMEVNTARVYNWDVTRRRKRREKEKEEK